MEAYMDRFTWGVVICVLALAAAALATVVVNRAVEAPPDLTTAEGTVRAFIAAVRDRRADDAWRLLESPEAVGERYYPAGQRMTESEFRREVNNLQRPSNRRVRIAETRLSGDTATVDVEIVSTSDGPFFVDGGSHTRRIAFSLRQVDGQWRITSAPSLWEIG
jgi:hypothetical protein